MNALKYRDTEELFGEDNKCKICGFKIIKESSKQPKYAYPRVSYVGDTRDKDLDDRFGMEYLHKIEFHFNLHLSRGECE